MSIPSKMIAVGPVPVAPSPVRTPSFEKVRTHLTVQPSRLPPVQGRFVVAPPRPNLMGVEQLLNQVAQAQKRLDRILELAASGKTFSSAELVALQAQVYQSSQELDVASKVVEKVTGGMKQVLQTQL